MGLSPLLVLLALAGLRMVRGDPRLLGTLAFATPVLSTLLLTAVGVTRLGVLPYIAITVALSVPLALASWLLVERPALGLKDLGPGRRTRRPVPAATPVPTLDRRRTSGARG